MPMLKSLSGLELDADQLIRSWHSWSGGSVDQFTSMSGGPNTVRVIELRALRSNAVMYATSARDLMSRADFPALAQNMRDDLTAIAEEMEILTAEIDDVAQPDNLWPSLDVQKKQDVTQHVTADDRDVAALRDRAKGNMRGTPKQPTPPSKRPPGPPPKP